MDKKDEAVKRVTDELYLYGQAVGGKYKDGRYVVSLIKDVVHNHYRVIAVVDYPSVRAIGNEDVFSRTEPRRYDSLISDDRSEIGYVPEKYEGEAVVDSEEGYKESVLAALRKEFVRYRDKGDEEAVTLIEELARRYTPMHEEVVA